MECQGETEQLALARRFIETEVPALRTSARRLCANQADADDLVQDAVVRALRSIKQLDLARNPRAWLVTILHNLHLDRLRAELKRRVTEVPVDELTLPAPEPVPEPDWAQVTTEQLLAAIDQLPDEGRITYLMFSRDNRSYREIARLLGIPAATVGTRLSRAREQLLRLLRPNPRPGHRPRGPR